MRFDPVRMIEACYAPLPDEQEWLRALLEASAPLEQGLGATAVAFTVADGRMRHDSAAVQRMPPETVARLGRFWEEGAHPDLLRAIFAPTPTVQLVGRVIRGLPDGLTAGLKRVFSELGGIRDALGVTAVGPDGRCVQITTPSRSEIRLPLRTQHQLVRVGAHLVSARRLRAYTAFRPEPEDERLEAVLDPSGHLHHAAGRAKEAHARGSLAEAVRRVERARGRLRRTDPEEALELWKGLVDGRWSLVDHYEADGRRFVLARRNEPGVRDPRPLTQSERDVLACVLLGHSNKYVGYLLGIAPTTVASHLNSVMSKLRFRSRRELLAVLRSPASREPASRNDR